MRIIFDIFIALAIIALIYIFGPILTHESKYLLNQMLNINYSVETTEEGTFEKPLIVPSQEFSVVIPKIPAAAPITKNVDINDPFAFEEALKKGVVHSKDSVLPGEEGVVLLYTHPNRNSFIISRHNPAFYLLGKLAVGNGFSVYYQGREIKYQVVDVAITDKTAAYNTENTDSVNTLTIQTNHPFGMAFKKLIVVSKELQI